MMQARNLLIKLQVLRRDARPRIPGCGLDGFFYLELAKWPINESFQDRMCEGTSRRLNRPCVGHIGIADYASRVRRDEGDTCGHCFKWSDPERLPGVGMKE